MNNQIELKGLLPKLPKQAKHLLLFFLSTILFGFIMGMDVVYETTNFNTIGIKENFIGNEENEDADIMIFKKSPREIKTMIHNHVLSLSVLFLSISILTLMSSAPTWLSKTLAIEPFLSLFFTFGGIFLIWKGIPYMNYVVMISGILMSISIILSLVFIIKDTIR